MGGYNMNNCVMVCNKIKTLCNSQYDFFLKKSNVIGVGLGCKIINGCLTNQLCLTVYVTVKRPSNTISPNNFIPKLFCGIPTDVVESGYVSVGTFNCTCSNSPLHEKVRPCNGGFSIGVDGMPDCSIGCLVKDAADKFYILTCNHSVAKNSEHSIGVTPVVQPSPKYGGRVPRDTIATVSKFKKVTLTGDNYIDAVICETNFSMVSSGLYSLGKIKELEHPTIGKKVAKIGSGSGLTKGTIKSLATVMKINFLGKEVLFKDQIITDAITKPGDEGSILINRKTNAAIGLVMGQTGKVTVCNNIGTVLQLLNVSIVTN
ncbi:hypothetical protein FDB08_02825 [Clostridium botulinum]|nr:hypothetical protein [Clostridium botulinum]NFL02189.1 hypothetical protein [Clostridium botulinum]